MGTVTILPETTRNPISLVGQRAGVCWGADTSDPAKNYKRGWDCITSGHGRTLEFVNIETVLDGYSARVMREWYTHIGGAPTRLQASTRYIDYHNLEYVVPQSIADNTLATLAYRDKMRNIAQTVQELEKMGIPREDAAMLLPLGMSTRVVDRRNLRNLIDMSRQRLCMRAYWEYRELFGDIIVALMNYSDEWERIVTTQFQPKCEVLQYCPEKNGCGRWPHERTENK